MEHAACPLAVGLHERRFFQNGFQLRGQVGIFPQDTDGLAAALLHQKGIGFTVSHGTAAQQLSIVVAGGVIGLFYVCHGHTPPSFTSGHHGPKLSVLPAAGLCLCGFLRLRLFRLFCPGGELFLDGGPFLASPCGC